MAGELPTHFESQESDVANGVYWADTPDEIDSIITNDLPSRGGIVRLRPGTYDDADWSQRIDIPTGSDLLHLGIDMRGSTISLNSFTPTDAYIRKGAESAVGDMPQLTILGPDVANLNATAPPKFVRVDDISESFINIPQVNGETDAIYYNDQTQGSGHMNEVRVGGFDVDRGIDLRGSSQSNDRSFYYGQIGSINDVGINLTNGQNNFFYAQPETGGAGSVGYQFGSDSKANRIYITHGGPDTPLDIQGQRNRVDYLGNPPSPSGIMKPSKLAVDPKHVALEPYATVQETSHTDMTARLGTSGSGSTSHNDFGIFFVEADANSSYQLQTNTRVGNATQNGVLGMLRGGINSTGSDRSWRVGFGDGGAGTLGNFVGFEFDSDTDTNWRAVVADSGSRNVDADTGIAADTNRHTFHVHDGNDPQTFSIDYEQVHVANQTSPLVAPERFYAEATHGGNFTRWELREFEAMGALGGV